MVDDQQGNLSGVALVLLLVLLQLLAEPAGLGAQGLHLHVQCLSRPRELGVRGAPLSGVEAHRHQLWPRHSGISGWRISAGPPPAQPRGTHLRLH